MPFKDGTGPAGNFRCFGQAQRHRHGWRCRSFSEIPLAKTADSAESEFLAREIEALEIKIAAMKKRYELLNPNEAVIK